MNRKDPSIEARAQLPQWRSALEEEIKDLEARLAPLQKRRADLIAQRAALETLISSGTIIDASKAAEASYKGTIDFATISMREAMRLVIRNSNAPLDGAKAVQAALLAAGYKDPSASDTPLRIRIGSELSKMVRLGEIHRVPQGYIP